MTCPCEQYPVGVNAIESVDAFCQPSTSSFLDGFAGDPFGISDVIGGVTNLFAAKEQKKAADAAAKAEKVAIKAQSEIAARQYALDVARAQAAPATAERRAQVLALWAVGLGAAAIALLFIRSAVKK
jgi:hypothetical protein